MVFGKGTALAVPQIEQQVTIPLEISRNGIPGVVHLRSFSLFDLSEDRIRRLHPLDKVCRGISDGGGSGKKH
jgi:hypothetical protein